MTTYFYWVWYFAVIFGSTKKAVPSLGLRFQGLGRKGVRVKGVGGLDFSVYADYTGGCLEICAPRAPRR